MEGKRTRRDVQSTEPETECLICRGEGCPICSLADEMTISIISADCATAEEAEEEKVYDEIQTIKKDLAFQLSFEHFDIEYFIETAERIREIETSQKEK